MRQSHLRLRSIRMKTTGKTITVLRPRELPALREGHRRMMRDFDYLSRNLAPRGVAGYAVVVWDHRGQTWDQVMVTEGGIIPRAAVPSFAKDALQRNLARDEVLDEIMPPEPDPDAG